MCTTLYCSLYNTVRRNTVLYCLYYTVRNVRTWVSQSEVEGGEKGEGEGKGKDLTKNSCALGYQPSSVYFFI